MSTYKQKNVCPSYVTDIKVSNFQVNFETDQVDIVLNNGDIFSISKSELQEFLGMSTSSVSQLNIAIEQKIKDINASLSRLDNVQINPIEYTKLRTDFASFKLQFAPLVGRISALENSNRMQYESQTEKIDNLNTRISGVLSEVAPLTNRIERIENNVRNLNINGGDYSTQQNYEAIKAELKAQLKPEITTEVIRGVSALIPDEIAKQVTAKIATNLPVLVPVKPQDEDTSSEYATVETVSLTNLTPPNITSETNLWKITNGENKGELIRYKHIIISGTSNITYVVAPNDNTTEKDKVKVKISKNLPYSYSEPDPDLKDYLTLYPPEVTTDNPDVTVNVVSYNREGLELEIIDPNATVGTNQLILNWTATFVEPKPS